jgi:AcrR family transcriptional regulator
MTPRPYRANERQRTVDAGRDRIIDAARELLEDADAEPFSIDAVARRASVARMTVYNQFASKAGLLEELFDSIAARGAFGQMSEVFGKPDPLDAMDAFIALFGKFWTESLSVHTGLRAAAMQDPELAAAMVLRNERRRQGLTVLVKRIGERHELPLPREETVNALFVLLSFDAFHAMAGPDRTPRQVVPRLRRLVRQILGVDAAGNTQTWRQR